jgi:fluoroacetyl-CoA thioesterase
MPNDSAPQTATSNSARTRVSMRYPVQDKDTVGFLVPGMPMVASTPYLVSVAEMACYEICTKLVGPGEITVGSRVVIDHLGASKVGAILAVDASLRTRERNRLYFDITIKDGERTVATVEHVRAAVSVQKLMAALG